GRENNGDVLGQGGGGQQVRRGDGVYHVVVVLDEFFGDGAHKGHVALGILVVDDNVFSDFVAGRFDGFEEPDAALVEGGVLLELGDADAGGSRRDGAVGAKGPNEGQCQGKGEKAGKTVEQSHGVPPSQPFVDRLSIL